MLVGNQRIFHTRQSLARGGNSDFFKQKSGRVFHLPLRSILFETLFKFYYFENALSINADCSSSCRFLKPVAGEAEAFREINFIGTFEQ